MHPIKIGILDEEKEYVKMLAAYLGRFGKGQWSTAAFTDREVLKDYLNSGKLDILAGTNREELKQFQKIYDNLSYLWLSDRPETGKREVGFYEIYRYQSARAVGKILENIAMQILKTVGQEKPMVAIYSPVGRCGKTTLALEVVHNEEYGRWLYIGMEDYSSFSKEQLEESGILAEPDDFFYFVKERQENKLLALIKESSGVIGSGSSLFDTRQVENEDMVWLKEVLRKGDYTGIIFDMGTGILMDLSILNVFDVLLVPYLKGEISITKKQNFDRMLDLYGLEALKEKIAYINMSNQDEIAEKMEEIFKGNRI